MVAATLYLDLVLGGVKKVKVKVKVKDREEAPQYICVYGRGKHCVPKENLICYISKVW